MTGMSKWAYGASTCKQVVSVEVAEVRAARFMLASCFNVIQRTSILAFASSHVSRVAPAMLLSPADSHGAEYLGSNHACTV